MPAWEPWAPTLAYAGLTFPPTPAPTPTPQPTLAPWVANAWEYAQLPIGTGCPPGPEVTTLEECEHAVASLGMVYIISSSVDSNQMSHGCYYRPGGTPLVCFNACSSCGSSTAVDAHATSDLHPICRQESGSQSVLAPTLMLPLALPTLAPTPAPAVASATGDPHLQNIHGERFDLMRPGKHALIHIPRRAPISSTVLHVEGDVQHVGGECEMYFQELNITGRWANARRRGGFRFRAGGPRREADSKWLRFGTVGIKIVNGRTGKGIRYLNFYVKHLATTGLVVGGLLGEDDHTRAAMRPSSCNHRIAL